jgi:hypothetical protein|tara:strand:- start:3860 stop:5533 length:1674 start_codon:yes stop_codon:yes gene_type:complete
MATPQSKIFTKAKAGNFKSILKKQKEQESDPKFAISDSLQEFQSQLESNAGYTNQMKLDKANIRQDIVNFVIDYTVSDLDALKGMDFDEAKTQQATTEKSIKEFEGLYSKGVLNDEEIIYIKETVGKTNAELKKILGLSTKLSLSFRDFKKELKPLKLAKRIGLTNVPIIGKKIERAIESEDRAEARGLQMKRQLRRKSAKADLKSDTAAPQPMEGSPDDKEDLAKRATAGSLGMDLSMPGFGGDGEEQVEEERESDKQFGLSSNLLEKIYEESKLTNELLGNNEKKSTGLLGGIAASLLGGGAIATGLAAMKLSLANSMRSLVGLPPKAVKTPVGPVGTAPSKTVPKGAKMVTKAGALTAAGASTTATAAMTKTNKGALVKNNVKKGAKIAGNVAKGAARVAGRVFLPLAAVMSIFDAASGVAQTGELLGKDEEDLTFRDKASAGFGGFLSGLTFGLIDKKKTANFLAGDSDAPSVAEQHDDLGLVKNDSKKLSTVEELKADKIDKLTIGTGVNGSTNINTTNIDSSSNVSKTEYGSTTIGTKNNDHLVKEFSLIP